MVGMGKKVGGELVVVPHESILQIMPDVFGLHLRKLLIHHPAIEGMHPQIDAQHLCCSPPRTGF